MQRRYMGHREMVAFRAAYEDDENYKFRHRNKGWTTALEVKTIEILKELRHIIAHSVGKSGQRQVSFGNRYSGKFSWTSVRIGDCYVPTESVGIYHERTENITGRSVHVFVGQYPWRCRCHN